MSIGEVTLKQQAGPQIAPLLGLALLSTGKHWLLISRCGLRHRGYDFRSGSRSFDDRRSESYFWIEYDGKLLGEWPPSVSKKRFIAKRDFIEIFCQQYSRVNLQIPIFCQLHYIRDVRSTYKFSKNTLSAREKLDEWRKDVGC